MSEERPPFPVAGFGGYGRAPVDARLRQLEQGPADARPPGDGVPAAPGDAMRVES